MRFNKFVRFLRNNYKASKILFSFNKIKFIVLALALFLIPVFVFSQGQGNLNTVDYGFRVIKNTIENGTIIDAHQICRDVKNASPSLDYFIPTRYAGEWNAFLAAVPNNSDLDAGACPNCNVGEVCEITAGINICATGNSPGNYSTVDNGNGTCTITFQANAANGQDATIARITSNNNFSNDIKLFTYSDGGSPSYQTRFVIKFDVKPVLSGVESVSNATLRLYRYDKSTPSTNWRRNQFTYIHRVTTPWSEDTVTWNTPWSNKGGDFAAYTDSVSTLYTYIGWNSFNLTADVNGFLTGNYNNYGWLASGQESTYGTNWYYSSDNYNNDATLVPKLEITYTKGILPVLGNLDGTCACVEVPTICAAGYYLDSDVCAISPAGHYSPANNNSLYECGANNKWSLAGAAACNTVTSGYYTTGGTATTRTGQTQCACGTYCSDGYQNNCSAGYYGATSGLTASACTGTCGQNDKYSGSASCGCLTVAPGEYTTGGNSTTRTGKATCELNHYCPGPGDGGKYACPANTYSPAGSDSVDDCAAGVICSAGYYSLGGVCTCSGNGYYSPANDNSRYVCPAGSTCSGCSSGPTLCSAGRISPAGSSFCIDCPCGTYNNSSGSTICWPGSEGYNCASGSSSPTANACVSGYNSTTSNCSYTCSGGYYDSNRDTICEEVTGPYYSPNNDYRKYNCPSGFTAPSGSDSASDCTIPTASCSGGYYLANGACTCAGDGYYSPADNNLRYQCAAGTYCSGCSESQTYCPPGKFSSTPGSSSCSNCSAGYHGSSFGNTNSTCDGCCESAYYCPAGSTSARQNRCPAGTDSDAYSSSISDCIACPPGTYYMDHINQLEMVLYDECHNGFNVCVDCPAGSYCNNSTRYDCPAGTYIASTNAQSENDCITCPAGSYCTGVSTYYTGFIM